MSNPEARHAYANLPLEDILEAVKFAERTSAMYAAGAEKRGHTVTAGRHRADAFRFARAHAALLGAIGGR